MKEKLTILQMLAEEKNIKDKLMQLVSDENQLVSYYFKNRPYVGARTAEEQETFQKENLQTINDLFRRYFGIRKAHIKANRETKVIVPCEPNLFDIIQDKETKQEEITIAEAISRKNNYIKKKTRMFTETTSLGIIEIAQKLLQVYNGNFHDKSLWDKKSREEIQEQLNKRFPPDSKNSWSQERYIETKKQLEQEYEVVRIDPYQLISNNAIKKFYDQIQKYILEIDVVIAQANASTIVEVEY